MAIVRVGIGAAWTLAFLGAAALQYNDPDPLLWMAMYGGAAVAAWGEIGPPACVAALHRMRWAWLAVSLAVAAGSLVASYLAVSDLNISLNWSEVFGPGGMMTAGVEEMREALGLLIVASRLGWLLYRQ